MNAAAVTRSSPFHVLAGALWRLLVAGVVLLALYVAAGRALMGNVSALQPQLLVRVERQRHRLAWKATRGETAKE